MHFLNVLDLTPERFLAILQDAIKLKKDRFLYRDVLKDKTIGLLFEKPSTRTRVSFDVGIRQMGGQTIVLNSSEIQLSRGESIKDTARVLSRFLDGLMIRTFSHQNLIDLTTYGKIPIINGLSNDFHPCQALADFMTIFEEFGSFEDKVICYLGDAANNVANTLALAAGMFGMTIRFGCPPEYMPGAMIREMAQKHKIKMEVYNRVEDAIAGAHVLYTDVWVSMGEEKLREQKLKQLADFTLKGEFLKKTAKDCIIMHCLPAHEGEEIDSAAIESPHSRIYDQAENRLHSQKALLKYIYSQK